MERQAALSKAGTETCVVANARSLLRQQIRRPFYLLILRISHSKLDRCLWLCVNHPQTLTHEPPTQLESSGILVLHGVR